MIATSGLAASRKPRADGLAAAVTATWITKCSSNVQQPGRTLPTAPTVEAVIGSARDLQRPRCHELRI
jgi:hypothetical protein